MIGAVRHRGPDEFGAYCYENSRARVGLGSARLKIIDLTGGQQPIGNEDGSVWIVFNGEIFNYVELRKELESRGHCMSTLSDTEVVVHLYEEYGTGCLKRLNGQFAFAIWDEKREQLFVARDRLGVRPLYYMQSAKSLVFASAIKCFLADPDCSLQLDPVALTQVFTYWSPIAPRTAFRNIMSLPPGCFMILGKSGSLHVSRYWQAEFPPAGEESGITLDDAAQQLEYLLTDAIRLRLRSDVPVGAYLSGGLDSSLVAHLVQRQSSSRFDTFSIAFSDAHFDESSFQRDLAALLGTQHHQITCTPQDIARVFPDVIWHAESPMVRTAPAPMFLLSSLVRDNGFRVVLTGEGADEFLAGYDIFKESKVRRFWARQPQSKWRSGLLQRLYADIPEFTSLNRTMLEQFFGKHLMDVGSPTYSHHLRWLSGTRSWRFFSDGLLAQLPTASHEAVPIPAEFNRWSSLAKSQYLELAVFLPDYLLSSQGDRMAMAHSVEGRHPFLDHRVVEFCNALPPGLKLRGLHEKHVLKKVATRKVPEAIRRRLKRPFRAPIHASFFDNGRPRAWVADLLSPAALEQSGCFRPTSVKLLVDKLMSLGRLGEVDSMALTGILSTQLVHQQFILQSRSLTELAASDDVKWIVRSSAANHDGVAF